jgi:hypothetical protein
LGRNINFSGLLQMRIVVFYIFDG